MPGARARAMARKINRVADEVSSFAPVPAARDRFKSAVNIVKVTNRFQLAGKVCHRAQSALARACNRVRVRVRAHARTARGKGCGREGKGIAHSGGAQ